MQTLNTAPILRLLAITAFPALWASVSAADDHQKVSFNRQIRPILSRHCFACHGPDEEARQSDLRLDDRDAAVDYGAIVPFDASASLLVERITSTDEDLRMPPADQREPLTRAQQELLTQWIQQGAEYAPHWAFVPPIKPTVPPRSAADRCNEIDDFVDARLSPRQRAPRAPRHVLARRVSLDLIGIPPTPEQLQSFLDDRSEDAYRRLVDSLLNSPRYGERWARWWLDLARYADSHGYEKDQDRSIWPYRDWVIRALNAGMPFDQFSIRQLAGDMLPDATADQIIATGFHRNTMLNEEGGIDPLEYRYYAMIDRVATTGTVWLGLTVGCAQCHSHKFDPITHTDFYRFMALMNNASEPDFSVPDRQVQQQRQRILAQIDALTRKLPARMTVPGLDAPNEVQRKQYFQRRFAEWLSENRRRAVNWVVLRPKEMQSTMPLLEAQQDGSILASGDVTKRDVYKLHFALDAQLLGATALRLEAIPDSSLPAHGPGMSYFEGPKGLFFLSEMRVRLDGRPLQLAAQQMRLTPADENKTTSPDQAVFDEDGSTGWSNEGHVGEPDQLVVTLAQPIAAGEELEIELLFERHFPAPLGRFRLAATSDAGQPRAGVPARVEQLLASQDGAYTPSQLDELTKCFCQQAPELEAARAEIARLRKNLPEFATTLVMREWPAPHRRNTHRHHRGEFLSPREEVAPGMPAVFVSSESTQPGNRLQMARWLVSEANPLVARVTVNRIWREFFGTGLVDTEGDFGTQCDVPLHRDLLDWLATTFIEEGLSLKALQRRIVLSATYQQSAQVTAGELALDPENKYLARGPRFRMPAEMVRDSLLQASGLLADKMYGPSVYPPQPASVTALAYGNPSWTASTGEDRYRRSLYTFSKRTAPFAAYAVFDAPSGEKCVVRRNRSNSPLQALTLLNDAMYLEMARALGQRVTGMPGTPSDRVNNIFKACLSRPAELSERADVLEFFRQQSARLADGSLNARTILDDSPAGKGSPQQSASASDAERAAWMLVARAIMNLDETITKP